MPRPSKGARLWPDKQQGVWYVRDGAVKRSTKCSLADRAGAERFLGEYVATKYEPPTDHRASKLFVADILTYYLREIARGHKSAAAPYAVDRLIEWWGAKTIADVKRSTCRDYVTYRCKQSLPQAKSQEARKRKVTTETARRELTVLRAAINAYHAETPLDALPVVTLPPASLPRQRWLTRDEVAAFLSAARKFEDKDAARALIRFTLIALYTASRSGAIRRLSWERNAEGGWVDLDGGVIHRRGDGEGETNKRKPVVRIPGRLMDFLRRWRASDRAKGIRDVIHYKGQPVAMQRKSWASAREGAKLGADVTPHILKHTAITWMMQAGTDPWDVSGYAGISIEMLEKVYAHHHPDFQKRASSRIGRKA